MSAVLIQQKKVYKKILFIQILIVLLFNLTFFIFDILNYKSFILGFLCSFINQVVFFGLFSILKIKDFSDNFKFLVKIQIIKFIIYISYLILIFKFISISFSYFFIGLILSLIINKIMLISIKK